MDVDLKDTSLFVAGWHGSTRKVCADGGKLNISNVHPLVFASTSCLGSNTGDHEKALRVTQRIVQVEPGFSDAWHLRSSIEMDLGMLDCLR